MMDSLAAWMNIEKAMSIILATRDYGVEKPGRQQHGARDLIIIIIN